MMALAAPARVKPRINSNLRDGRDEIAFVQAARLVVDENDAAADHGGNEDGQDDCAGKEKLDVGDVRINLDDGEVDVGGDAGRNGRRVVSRQQGVETAFQGGGGELVGVVLDQGDARIGAGEDFAGELRRDIPARR